MAHERMDDTHRKDEVRREGERRGEERTVELREEELRARRRPVEAGEVELHKEVVSEQKTIDVPVTREEAYVERHPVDRHPSDRPIGEGETIKVPLREERVEVEKRPVVREEVEVGKRQVQETQRVSGTVRREEVGIEHGDDSPVHHRGRIPHWDDVRSKFQSTWQQRQGSSGRRWEDAEPGYHYGHEMSGDPRYQGRSWSEVEPKMRTGYTDWSKERGYRHDDDPWERLREDVRDAFESSRSGSAV